MWGYFNIPVCIHQCLYFCYNQEQLQTNGVKEAGITMITAQNITFSYRDGQRRLPVLQGISIHIARGEWVALTGANGCGKSSLVRMFNGLNIPSAGSLHAAGLDLRSAANRTAVKQHIQLVFQNPESQNIGSTPMRMLPSGWRTAGWPGMRWMPRSAACCSRWALPIRQAMMSSPSPGRKAAACCGLLSGPAGGYDYL